MTRFSALDRLALRAALKDGPEGHRALSQLLDEVDFENAKTGIWRLSPLIDSRAKLHGIAHPLMRRISGVARHIWLSNEVRMRGLSEFLELIGQISPAVIFKGGATFVRFGALGNLRPMGDLDLLVLPEKFHEVVAQIKLAGWLPNAVVTDADPGLPDKTPGAPFTRGGNIYDLHWSPLPDVPDPDLSRLIIDHSDTADFGGREVSVPAMHHHLALLILHADERPFEEFGRVDWACEAVLALEAAGEMMDWRRFDGFVRSYGLQVRVEDVLEDLSTSLGRRVGKSARSFFPAPMLRIEQQLRVRSAVQTSRMAGGFLAFQKQKRGAGWRWSRLLTGGRFLPALAQTSLAAIEASEGPLPVLATQARRWAEHWRFHGRLRDGYSAGWSWPELSGGRWSDGRVAVASVPAPALPGSSALLRVAAIPFLPWPNDPLRIVADAGAAVHHFSLDYQRQFTLTIPAVVGSDGYVTAGFAFDLPARDPAHPDPRRLALFVSRFDVVQLQKRSFPITIELGEMERAQELGSGWSSSEADGIWTDSNDSELFVQIDEEFESATVVFELDQIAPGPAVDVAIAVGERWKQNIHLDGAIHTISQAFGPDDCTHGLLSVRIHTRNPRSPASLGLNADLRHLGVRVQRVRLQKREVLETRIV